jgi:hypothetical protein
MYNVSDIINSMGRIKRTTSVTLSYADIQAQDDGQNVSAVGAAFVKKYYHFAYVRAGVVNCKVKKSDATFTTHTMKKASSMCLIDCRIKFNILVSKDVCGVCGNGEDDDDSEDDTQVRAWMRCERCLQWFHQDCLGFDNDDESSVYYECEACR